MARLDKIFSNWPVEKLARLPGVQGSPLSKSSTFLDDVQKLIINADPTKNKKMVGWILNAWQRKTFQLEDLYGGGDSTVGQTLEKFDRYGKIKAMRELLPADAWSLMKYKGPGDIEEAIMPCTNLEESIGDTPTKREEKRRLSALCKLMSWQKDYPSGLKATIPWTKTASQFYGQKTRWCTAAQNSNQYKSYIASGPLVILTLPGGTRFQAWLDTSTRYCDIMDEMDRYLSQEQVDVLRPYIGDLIDVFSKFLPKIVLPKDFVEYSFLRVRDKENMEFEDISTINIKEEKVDFDFKKEFDISEINRVCGVSKTICRDVGMVSLNKKHYIGIYLDLEDIKVIETLKFKALPATYSISSLFGTPSISGYVIVPKPGIPEKTFYEDLFRDRKFERTIPDKQTCVYALNKYPELLSLLAKHDLENHVYELPSSLRAGNNIDLIPLDTATEYAEYCKDILEKGELNTYDYSTTHNNIKIIALNSRLSLATLSEFLGDGDIRTIHSGRVSSILRDETKTPKDRARQIIELSKDMPEAMRKSWHFSSQTNINYILRNILMKDDIRAIEKIIMESPYVNPDSSFRKITFDDIKDHDFVTTLSCGLAQQVFSPELHKTLLSFSHQDSDTFNLKHLFLSNEDIKYGGYSPNEPGWRPLQYQEYQKSFVLAKILEFSSPASEDILKLALDGKFKEFFEEQRLIKTREAMDIWSDPKLCSFVANRLVSTWERDVQDFLKDYQKICVAHKNQSPEPS